MKEWVRGQGKLLHVLQFITGAITFHFKNYVEESRKSQQDDDELHVPPILSTLTQPRKCDFQAESSGTPSKSTRSKRMKRVIHNPGKIICSASYFCSDYTKEHIYLCSLDYTKKLLMIEVTALKKPNSTLIYSGLVKLLYSIEIIWNTSTLSVYESVVLCLQWWRKEKGVICLKISLWWDFVRIEIPSQCIEVLENIWVVNNFCLNFLILKMYYLVGCLLKGVCTLLELDIMFVPVTKIPNRH